MKNTFLLFLAFALMFSCTTDHTPKAVNYPEEGTLQLHPENPHYFLYKGQTLALITSAEHYGAVLNLDFDYETYLNTLASEGMNYTRIFTGTYFERPGDFGIEHNTLAPAKARICTPWAIVVSGLEGEVQYDLNSWNDTYFDRLRAFMAMASAKNIIVEVTLFSSVYRGETWGINPQNPDNNINIDGKMTHLQAHVAGNEPLWQYQEKFVRKIVTELNDFDNFFFEIQNEPWSDHTVPVFNIANKSELKADDWTNKADFASEASLAWQQQIVDIIVDEEAGLAKQHLIAQNYANFKAPIPMVNQHISIINFHYAWPEAALWNYHYGRVLGFDESGFAGAGEEVYRRQAWQFMLSGGGLFNNLDYSFYEGQETGDGSNNAPGGGGKILRSQLKALSSFIHSFQLAKLRPANDLVAKSPGLIPFVMANGHAEIAVYLRVIGTDVVQLGLHLPDGLYAILELNTLTGEYNDARDLSAKDGILYIETSATTGELALKISKKD
ncbi:MAG: hypothetical protein HC819_20985 [Cyclobacteriaceae bacterium]|nr:hypothetical protein [Cyclobacteriaceae bacterium]